MLPGQAKHTPFTLTLTPGDNLESPIKLMCMFGGKAARKLGEL